MGARSRKRVPVASEGRWKLVLVLILELVLATVLLIVCLLGKRGKQRQAERAGVGPGRPSFFSQTAPATLLRVRDLGMMRRRLWPGRCSPIRETGLEQPEQGGQENPQRPTGAWASIMSKASATYLGGKGG